MAGFCDVRLLPGRRLVAALPYTERVLAFIQGFLLVHGRDFFRRLDSAEPYLFGRACPDLCVAFVRFRGFSIVSP